MPIKFIDTLFLKSVKYAAGRTKAKTRMLWFGKTKEPVIKKRNANSIPTGTNGHKSLVTDLSIKSSHMSALKGYNVAICGGD
jgi:hypothetical protein